MKKHLVAILTTVLTLVPVISIADTNAEAIEARQAAFKTIKASMADVKDAMTAENFTAAADSARKVLENAKAVTTLFPADSYEGDTRAREKIWANLEDFTQRQQKLITDSETLLAAAELKDTKQLKAAFKQTASNCKGCHSKYREIW